MTAPSIPHLCAAVVLACALAAPPGRAATLEKGTVEIAPAVAFAHSGYSFDGKDVGSMTVVTMSGDAGYFLTDLVEAQAGFLLTHVSVSEPGGPSESATGVGATGGLRFNFAGSGSVVPFLAAGAGFVSYSNSGGADTSLETLAPLLQAGVRLLVGPTGSVNLFAQYVHRSNASGVKDLSDNQFALGVGMSLFPGRK